MARQAASVLLAALADEAVVMDSAEAQEGLSVLAVAVEVVEY